MFYLEVLLKDRGKLLPFHLVVVDPGIDGHFGALGARHTVCKTKMSHTSVYVN